MQDEASRPQLTSLLSTDVLNRLERLRIKPRRRFVNRTLGEHLSGKGGSSTEFSDYRDYAAGDDLRFVDWNIFARLNRPYTKLYRLEEEMHVVVLIDASSSMDFEGKLDRAKELGAVFGLMGLLGGERASVYCFNRAGSAPARLAPCGGRASMMKLFAFIEDIQAGGDAPLEGAMESFLRRHMGRGVAVILSDFLTFGDVGRGLNLVFGAGLEPFGIQILAPGEIDPEVAGDLRMVDCETQQMLDVTSAADLLGLYEEHRAAYERELAVMCQHRSGRFASISSAAPLEWVLFDLLRRRGWVQ
jgi:uncharacterized protein (DUF58 family)